MSNREFTATRTMLANGFATAGAELLDYMGTAAALAAIPNTDPPRYVVAGTLAMIAKVLPSADAPAAATVLTDERIEELFTPLMPWLPSKDGLRKFARHIEREVLAQAGVTAEPVGHVSVPRTTLLMIYEAMNYMGDKLNGMDACEDEDEEATTPAFDAVRELLDDSYAASATAAQVPAAEVRADALEEAAKACDEIESDRFDAYKGRGKHAPNNPDRADPYMNGKSDGAGECAAAIRSLAQSSTADSAGTGAMGEGAEA